jgi:hypothetical protein
LYDKKRGTVEMDEYNAKAVLAGKLIQKFDSKSREISETFFIADGSIAWIKTYEYDAINNWIKSILSNRVMKFGKIYDEPASAEYRTIEYYE